ncbi:hypothetical protein [Bradyrhizobium sp. USDA 4473]
MLRRYKLSYTRKGLAVRMSDGWHGRIDFETGDTIVCIENGKAPNDWLDGYRAFSRKLIASETKAKMSVTWTETRSSAATVGRAELDAFLSRAKLRREWERVPSVLH